jgi:selenide, water dikinase
MKKLLLIGGGHSHVEVMRRFGLHRSSGHTLTVVNPTIHTPYSGMLPGLIAGHYTFAQCHIDLPALAQATGCRFKHAAVNGMHPGSKLAFCNDGDTLEYDIASIDIGSTPATLGVSGAAHFGLKVKPTDHFLREWASVLDRAGQGTLPDGFRIAIAGGGAAGVEVLLAIQYRLERTGFVGARYAVVTDSDEVLPGHPASVQTLFRRVMSERGVALHRNQRIVEATPDGLVSASGEHIRADLVIWATGASPAGWPGACGLAVDDRGFLRIGETLQVCGQADIFATGDIASMDGSPRPKSGVYAVRQGPPLADNLLRTLSGKPLLPYRAQRRALALISTGDRYAIASRGWLFAKGKWVWRWKDHIDRSFMKRYGVTA